MYGYDQNFLAYYKPSYMHEGGLRSFTSSYIKNGGWEMFKLKKKGGGVPLIRIYNCA